MATTFKMKQGDTRPKITLTLYSDEAKTTPVDLTNAAANGVRLIVGNKTDPPVVSKALTVVNAAGGVVEYQWTAGDTDFTTGSYQMEVEVTWTDGTKSSYPKDDFLTFQLIDDLDVA